MFRDLLPPADGLTVSLKQNPPRLGAILVGAPESMKRRKPGYSGNHNMTKNDSTGLADRTNEALRTPTDLGAEGVEEISSALRELLADVFALYVKTKNFHWHMSGSHFRDYHLLLDEQGEQIFSMTDDIAERARKIGGTTLHSIGDIAEHQRLKDNNADFVPAKEMLAELAEDNQKLTQFLRATHEVCDRHNDVATASLIENWIDETERRTWFLFETQHGE
jgi:starvation-inducible DNA-binding protein